MGCRVADTLTYTVADVRTNPPAVYRSGDTMLTGTGLVQILPLPVFGGVALSGNTLTLSGSNGIPGAAYYVLTSTNVSLPVPNWRVVATNTFDTNGRFNFTAPMDPNGAQQFYLLRLQ